MRVYPKVSSYGDHLKEDEMVKECNTHGREKMHRKFQSGNVKEATSGPKV
jgi:hypothetical protein